MTKHFVLVCLFLLSSPLSFAQEKSDFERFASEAGELSNLYRGEAPLIYNFRHTGTYYAYTENFEKGEIVYNGKFYNNVFMNLNSHRDELNILIDKSKRVVVLNKDFVEEFSFGGRSFVYYRGVAAGSGPDLQPGYYQVLYNGPVKLYKKIKKNYSERVNETMSIQSKNKLERIFSPVENYYLVRGNSYRPLNSRSDFFSCYKEKKRDIRQFIKEKGLDMRHDKDHSFAEIVRFVESGSGK